ncbi:ABC transporter ATP-binding protein [Slackia piriformis]|uniref:ABC transporter ATP-binding protein n=1 Tax=Slackia piriformis TaxID=626934 RepID=UPI0026DC8372|nr:ABC transporter ATP-binding protein [Slackia piriformis]MDO5023424.1 ABC transporter ATP-binding protein [Slackia piriformis]
MSNVLDVRDLRKVYAGIMPHTALDGISLSVEQGESVGIMGPSGSGKSTLLNIVSTMDTPTSGDVFIADKNVASLSEDELAAFRRRNLGFVFQDFNLVHTLTVEENILLPLALDGIDATASRERAHRLARALGIDGILSKRTFEISGGQAQRVAIARAIAARPSLILADEPTGNLDSAATGAVMNLLASLNARQGATIVMVTHEPLVASYCSRVLIIKDGRLHMEIRRGDSQREFHQRINNAMNHLGGIERDLA